MGSLFCWFLISEIKWVLPSKSAIVFAESNSFTLPQAIDQLRRWQEVWTWQVFENPRESSSETIRNGETG